MLEDDEYFYYNYLFFVLGATTIAILRIHPSLLHLPTA
jgi:hypothetical protein